MSVYITRQTHEDKHENQDKHKRKDTIPKVVGVGRCTNAFQLIEQRTCTHKRARVRARVVRVRDRDRVRVKSSS